MITQFDIPFSCPADIEPYLQKIFSGEYDVPVFLYAPRIIDLGANCGAFSLWATHRFPGCVIDAYEPHPETYKYLERNTARYANIRIHNYGVGTPGMRILHNGLNNCGEASFHIANDNHAPTGQHIEVIDPLRLPEADILKLDIEGCELEVLRPLIEKSTRRPSLILLEWHNHGIRRTIEELLIDYHLIGAQIYSIDGLGVFKYMRKDLISGVAK